MILESWASVDRGFYFIFLELCNPPACPIRSRGKTSPPSYKILPPQWQVKKAKRRRLAVPLVLISNHKQFFLLKDVLWLSFCAIFHRVLISIFIMLSNNGRAIPNLFALYRSHDKNCKDFLAYIFWIIGLVICNRREVIAFGPVERSFPS